MDGGKTIQSFLQQDLIDELIITTIPTIFRWRNTFIRKIKRTA
ncbi:hypothetical protein [Pseudoalteromonas sp. JC28]